MEDLSSKLLKDSPIKQMMGKRHIQFISDFFGLGIEAISTEAGTLYKDPTIPEEILSEERIYARFEVIGSYIEATGRSFAQFIRSSPDKFGNVSDFRQPIGLVKDYGLNYKCFDYVSTLLNIEYEAKIMAIEDIFEERKSSHDVARMASMLALFARNNNMSEEKQRLAAEKSCDAYVKTVEELPEDADYMEKTQYYVWAQRLCDDYRLDDDRKKLIQERLENLSKDISL